MTTQIYIVLDPLGKHFKLLSVMVIFGMRKRYIIAVYYWYIIAVYCSRFCGSHYLQIFIFYITRLSSVDRTCRFVPQCAKLTHLLSKKTNFQKLSRTGIVNWLIGSHLSTYLFVKTCSFDFHQVTSSDALYLRPCCGLRVILRCSILFYQLVCRDFSWLNVAWKLFKYLFDARNEDQTYI